MTIAGKPTAIAYYRDSDGITRPMQRQGKTPAAAERALLEALRDRLAPSREYLNRDSTLELLSIQWVEEIRKSKRAASTKERYEGTVRAHVNEAVGGVRVREATVPRIQRIIDRVAKNSGAAQARMLGVVFKGMFGLAVRMGAADSNVGLSLLLPPVETKEVRAPTIAEIRIMRAAFKTFDRVEPKRGDSIRDLADVGDMLAGTGTRIGEVLALRWQDIDLNAGTVSITGTVSRIRGQGIFRQDFPKSQSSMRTLSLPRFVIDMLVRRRVRSYSEWVFPSSTGKLRWPENVRQQWDLALEKTSVSWMTTKACRKAVATLLDDEIDVDAAKDQLGHSGKEVTSKHYLERKMSRPDRSLTLDAFAENPE